ncbi:mannan endo-1,4-beta-mannosidase-like [Littorina saxatilis]|uniref:GH26 domain-containing protein n=1 Tax=Littorina saxatilis TaxID=31220 RepID=A0AAN9B1I1_9CAEN
MELYLLGAILLATLPLDVTSGPVDQHATSQTQTLYNVLHKVARDSSRILVGKHLPTLFGLYGGHSPYWLYEHNGKQEAWMYNPDMAHSNHADELCDPCALTNDFPAIAGFDFSMIGNDIEDAWVYLLQKAHDRGAIITFSFHTNNMVTGKGPWIGGDHGSFHVIQKLLPGGDHYSKFTAAMDKIADFVKRKMVDKNGHLIPIIFRPWHELDGGWFWWGMNNDAHNSVDDIKHLYQNTVTYLRDHKGVHNFLYAFSPDCGGRFDDDDALYPGNSYVDIIGTDCYLTPNRGADYLKTAIDKVVTKAEANGKIPALTETGVIQEDLTKRSHFFTQDMLHTFTSSSGMRMAYMLTWNNQHQGNGEYSVYDPYPGHPLANDYMTFYHDGRTFFLKDLKSQYSELYH